MTLTRQHFELIAELIRDGRIHYRSDREQIDHAEEIARRLALTNPRFNAATFLAACMPTEWVGTRRANAWERAERRVSA